MPTKNTTETPRKQIERFIRRHVEGGEPVAALAKEYRVSRAAAYLWLKKHREQVVEQSMREGMSSKSIEKAEKLNLAARVRALEIENAKLRNKVVSLMIKAGEL